MTDTRNTSAAAATHAVPAVALASRGDALTPYLAEALARRADIVARIDPELTPRQRYQVAAATFRPNRSRWVERFYKSAYAYRLRSANARRQWRALPDRPRTVLQVHALFRIEGAPSMLYVDCTHRQSAESWPAWNPLRGAALERWYRREREAYRDARHLFAFCEPTRDSLVDDYGVDPDRVTVVGAGINLSEVPSAAEAAPTASDQAPTILFIGNDFVRKGGLVLLEAFRAVRRAIPEARLVLVGTEPGVRAEPGVIVLGRVHDRARIAELYASATVFTVPSYFDPFPLVLLEAMAYGLPSVATRQTGVPEMVEHGVTGLLVEAGDADALAEALLATLTDETLAARLGAAAKRDVESRLTWDAVVDRMLPALQRMSEDAP